MENNVTESAETSPPSGDLQDQDIEAVRQLTLQQTDTLLTTLQALERTFANRADTIEALLKDRPDTSAIQPLLAALKRQVEATG